LFKNTKQQAQACFKCKLIFSIPKIFKKTEMLFDKSNKEMQTLKQGM
jgi:hypothetical protein